MNIQFCIAALITYLINHSLLLLLSLDVSIICSVLLLSIVLVTQNIWLEDSKDGMNAHKDAVPSHKTSLF